MPYSDFESLEKEVYQFCMAYLEAYMVPKIIREVSIIPRSETGKVLIEEVKKCLI